MKLLISFNYFEGEFLLKEAQVLKESLLFKDKKQSSKLYELELYGERCYFALLGMTQVLALPSLQKILSTHSISSVMLFGSAGSYKEHVGKLVIIHQHQYPSELLNKYFSLNTKLPKWTKRMPKLDIFSTISVDDVAKPEAKTITNTCFDMETSEIAYLLKINKIEGAFFRILTDCGEINFQEMKEVYASKTEQLLSYIEAFLKA